MFLIVGTNKYPIDRAEQILTATTERLTVFSSDATLDLAVIDADIRAYEADGFYIDEVHFVGFTLNSIRKSFDAESYTTVSMEFSKER